MNILVITDIPRMADLFESLAAEREGLVVVSEIHRGVEELERIKPSAIIIQNHLSGLSAEILLKHLKSHLGRRRCRFALISPSETMDVETSAKFDAIMDPSQSDSELTALLDALAEPPERRVKSSGDSAKPVDGDIQADTSATAQDEDGHLLPEPLTYSPHRRPNLSIISAFSQQLDTRSDELPSEAAPVDAEHPHDELKEKLLQNRDELLITDVEDKTPLWRKGWAQALAATVLLAVAITTYQHKADVGKPSAKQQPEAEVQPVQQSLHSSVPSVPGQLATHGSGRPKTLPSFVPKGEQDKGYSKEHPGWENYLGLTSEYRVFRENDGAIKSIQIIDRSGAGIQESYYVAVLKEVAGKTAMRPVSSEIKEGYEIRKGEAGGLQVIQYRDAQGGRLRGIVVVWP